MLQNYIIGYWTVKLVCVKIIENLKEIKVQNHETRNQTLTISKA